MSETSEPKPPPSHRGVDPLRRALFATALRVRLQRAMNAGALFALVGLGLAGLVVAFLKTDALPEAEAVRYLWAAGALPLLAAAAGALRPVPRLLAAKLLDRSHGLSDRVSNAVSFAAEARPTPFMVAAIQDANRRASELRASRAMPFTVPPELLTALGLSLGVAALFALEVPRSWEERIVHDGIVPVLIHEDDLAAYQRGLRDLLEDPDADEDVRAAAREFNRIVEDLADERLDREESLRRIADLERRLSETRPADDELLSESLRELGEDLRRSNLADELSRALQEADADRAEAAMRRMAERLRQDEASRRDVASLQRAMARAAQRRAEDRSSEIEQREEQMNRLLQRQRERAAEQTPQQRRLLQRRRRELDRLRRQHAQAQERQRQLERLRRELSRGAESLQRDQQDQAADSLDRGAEDLNRMARQQLSEQEMRQLQQQLRQLREAIRRAREQRAQGQQGRQGQQRQGQGQGQSRMDRFVLRARGQGDGEGVRLGLPGQGGQQGSPGQGQGQQGQQGQNGGSGQQQQTLTLGGDGEPNATLEIPGMGQPQGAGQGSGRPQPGPGAGTGHDDTTLDDPSRIAGSRRTVRVEGEQGEGPSRSEVIRSSGQRGFASRGYQETYPEYRGHAEEVLERDEVPPGRRFYVRRYFQLIRPRD